MAYLPESLHHRVVLMIAASIVDVGLHVCKVQALVVATTYQSLDTRRLSEQVFWVLQL